MSIRKSLTKTYLQMTISKWRHHSSINNYHYLLLWSYISVQKFHTKSFPLHYGNSYPNSNGLKATYNETLMSIVFAFLDAFINKDDCNIIVMLSSLISLNIYQHSELHSNFNASDNKCNRYNFTCKTQSKNYWNN